MSRTFTWEHSHGNVHVTLCVNNESTDQVINDVKGCKGILGCAGVWRDEGNNYIKLVTHNSVKDEVFEYLKERGFQDCGISEAISSKIDLSMITKL